ncbi:putative ribonuclease H-like domain-containing protein [Tanacetum coccineum]
MNVSNSTGVESSNSVRRPNSKDTKSKDRVLKNTNDKRPSAHVLKKSSSVSIDSNKNETMYLNVCQSNASVLNTKIVNAVNDGSNIVCVSCGKDVFLLSYEKCVACYALSRDSKVKRALFTTPVAARSKNLGATSVVAKSRLSVAKTPTTTNKGDDFTTGSRESNIYTISIFELAASSLVCLMSKVTSTKSWLWHQRLSHLNFACEQGKNKKASLPPKFIPSTKSKLELLHIDLYEPMKVASINGKKYILVIVDDYSRYTWVYFLRTKDEALDMIINFINQVQQNLKAQILKIRTDNETEFKNEKLLSFYAKLGIVHNTSIALMPQQNGVVECRNQQVISEPNTLVLNDNADELVQEDIAELDGNVFYILPQTPVFEEAESSSTYQDPSNMQEFHQTHRSTDKWTKIHVN